MGNIKVFQVTKTTPVPSEQDVETIVDIKISFNTDVNVKTLSGGITMISRDENSPIFGSISYDGNRTASFRPAVPLYPSVTYDIYVKSSIENILGLKCKPFSFSFTTRDGVQFTEPVLLHPANESILNSTPEFKWEGIDGVNKYEIEVSKSEYFETNYWITETTMTSIQSDIEIETGTLLFWRVRGISYNEFTGDKIDGPWSEVYRFIVARSIAAPIVEADGDYLDPAYEELPQIENEILKLFPEQAFSNVGTNLKTIYVEIDGLLDLTKINPKTWVIEGSHVTGSLNIDDYNPEEDQDEVNHLYLTGTWFVVLDEDNMKTYILFQPDKL